MLTTTPVHHIVEAEIKKLLPDTDSELGAFTGDEKLTELALNSLLLARLIIELGEAVGIDPFTSGDASLGDVRSVNDLVAVYETALLRNDGSAES